MILFSTLCCYCWHYNKTVFLKKNGSKQSIFLAYSFCACKIVFALLEKIIALHVVLILVYVKDLSFQQFILWGFYNSKNRSQKKFSLKDSFENALKIIFIIIYYNDVDGKKNSRNNGRGIIFNWD